MPFGSINLSEWRDRIQIAACLPFNTKFREANLDPEPWHGIGYEGET